jgi:anti-anti-sigma factor
VLHGNRRIATEPDSESAAPAELTIVQTGGSASDHVRHAVSARAAAMPDFEPFVVETQRREHVTIVQPRGELDIATVETLRSALDAAIAETLRVALDSVDGAARLVLDLRGLSFIDSTGLHLLMASDERAKRDGLLLTLIAPAPPIDRAIQVSGLDQVLPFALPDDAVD